MKDERQYKESMIACVICAACMAPIIAYLIATVIINGIINIIG